MDDTGRAKWEEIQSIASERAKQGDNISDRRCRRFSNTKNYLIKPWMADIDSWIGRRMYGFFNKSNLFESSVSVHNVVENEYTEGTFGYDLSQDIAWLYKENTGTLSKEEYDVFIHNLKPAQEDGQYIFSKPYYIYKGVKKLRLKFPIHHYRDKNSHFVIL